MIDAISPTPAPSVPPILLLPTLSLRWCPECYQWLVHISGRCSGHVAGPETPATLKTEHTSQSSVSLLA